MTDGVQELLAEGIDLAIRISPAVSPDAVVRRVTTISLVCVGSCNYFAQHGTPRTPQELIHHNCLIFNGTDQWVFDGPRGQHIVRVSGNLASNTVETILSAVQAGVGIGMFNGASLAAIGAVPTLPTYLMISSVRPETQVHTCQGATGH